MLPDDIDSKWLTRFRRSLRNWYHKNARDLPWRQTNDAYRIWISEIMLQQTTVAAVIPYFDRWFQNFPNVEALSNAKQDEVLKQWEGLGYYSRARNIHKTAKLIVSEYDGQFPQTVDGLTALPGIGRYTAGAICSFAFDQPAAIVEANTLRLYSRLLGYADDPRSTSGQKVLWRFAERIVPKNSPGIFNQALMELGAKVCTPNQPTCLKCPVKSCCEAFANDTVDQIPKPKAKKVITPITEVSVAILHRKKYLLRLRTENERWAGLWDFVRFEIDNTEGESVVFHKKSKSNTLFSGDQSLKKKIEAEVAERTGLSVSCGDAIREIVHSVTRYRIRLLCFSASRNSGTLSKSETFKWLSPTEFDDYPLSVTGRKLAETLAASQTK